MKSVACYVRVSTYDQDKGLRSQEKALKEYCMNNGYSDVIWYQDKLSGATIERPAFVKLQRDIFTGKIGTVVCWKLDRLSRSLKDGINILTDWINKGVRIIATSQQLDFSGPAGQLIASVLFAVAAMERETLRENTRRGIAAAKARGARLGKRPKLFAKDIVPMIENGMSISAISDKLIKSRVAIYNALKREGIELAEIRK